MLFERTSALVGSATKKHALTPKAVQHVREKNSVTKKPIFGKPLAKHERMCYNILRAPVIRLYRSAVSTSVQDCHTPNMAVCLFLYLYYTANCAIRQHFLQKTKRQDFKLGQTEHTSAVGLSAFEIPPFRAAVAVCGGRFVNCPSFQKFIVFR